jgi:hypothetical protein
MERPLCERPLRANSGHSPIDCYGILGRLVPKKYRASRSSNFSSSEDPRDNAVCSRHVLAIAVSKGFQHQSFFSGYSAKKQNPKTGNARETRHPIWQKQCLSDSPKPECGIHRVPHLSVDAVSDQLMTFAYIEANRPVAPKGTVRQPKHNQRSNCKEKPQPSLGRLKCVSREMRDGGRHVKERHNTETGQRYQHQRSFTKTPTAPQDRCAVRLPRIFESDEIPTDCHSDK